MKMESDTLNELFTAMSKAQGEISNAKKSKTGVHRSTYADLAGVMDCARGPLSKNGLTVIQIIDQTPEMNTSEAYLITTLGHISGQWIKARVRLDFSKDVHSSASQITYMKRYSFCAIVGIATEDDDGHKAASSYQAPKPKQYQKPAIPKQENTVPKISPKQVQKLTMMVGTDKEAIQYLSKYLGSRSVNDIPPQDFVTIVQNCNQIIDKNKEKTKQEEQEEFKNKNEDLQEEWHKQYENT